MQNRSVPLSETLLNVELCIIHSVTRLNISSRRAGTETSIDSVSFVLCRPLNLRWSAADSNIRFDDGEEMQAIRIKIYSEL